MSTPELYPGEEQRLPMVGCLAFFTSLGLGCGALLIGLVAYDTPTPRLPVAMAIFGVIYALVGFACGLVFPRHSWHAVLGICTPVFLMFAWFFAFGLVALLSGKAGRADLETMLLGAVVTTAALVGAAAGAAAGRRLRPQRSSYQ